MLLNSATVNLMLKTKGEETEGLIIFVFFCIFCYFCSFSCFNRRWLGVGRVGRNESGYPVFLVLFEDGGRRVSTRILLFFVSDVNQWNEDTGWLKKTRGGLKEKRSPKMEAVVVGGVRNRRLI